MADPSFGRWLQRRRKALDLTQAELGKRVGYAAVTIHKIETDQLRPSREMAHKLADELAIELTEREAFLLFARDEFQAGPPVLLPPVPERLAAIPSPRHGHDLPFALTRFLGREDEVQVGSALLAGDVRLLTLTGAGGIGKTRLGREIAASLVNTFADGVWFVDLAPLADPDLVLAAVATVLGVREDPSQPIQVSLVRAVRDRHLLLVFDNCEHLVNACARLIEEILRNAPSVRILATSRVALRVAGEVSRPVGPLAFPPPGAILALDQVQQYAAVQLFLERALAVQPGITITDENAWTLGQICQRLDGMPLALELAAARVNVLSLEQLAARLDDRFRLLTGGSRTALPRHQTLRATLDWSYDLLSRPQRSVFQEVAVFAGSWTLEAAEAIASSDEFDHADVLDSLAALIDQSLVIVEDRPSQRRYRFLETLRQYGWERLLETGRGADAQRRHLEWYLGLAERSDPEVPGTQERVGQIQLATEYDNLRAALAWSLDNDPVRALRLAGCLADFWRRGGHHAEGRRWLNAVLATSDQSSGSVGARARVIRGIGNLAADVGEFGPEQLSLAAECVRLFREAGDQRGLVDALQYLGRCLFESGEDVGQVQSVFDESLRVARTIGDQHGIGFALANLAELTWVRGDHTEALVQYKQAVEQIRASGDSLFTGLVLGLLGWYTLVSGDHLGARRYKEESLAILRSLEARESVGLALLGLAHVALQARDDAWLSELLEESAPLLLETGSPGLADWLSFAGRVRIERGEYAQGIRLLAAGESERPRFGSLRYLLYQIPREVLDATITSARSALGEAAFKAAWEEGKALALQQAIATVLAERELNEAK